MSTSKGLGIAAIILAVLGAVMPGIGLFVGWLALILATFAAAGDGRGLAIATIVVSAMAFLFLTPSLWIEAAAFGTGYGEATGSSPILRIVSLVLLVAPVAAMFLGKNKITEPQ